MKNLNKKINKVLTLSFALSFVTSVNSFASIIYSPGSSLSTNSATPFNDPTLNIQSSNAIISELVANKISNIVINEEQIIEPTASTNVYDNNSSPANIVTPENYLSPDGKLLVEGTPFSPAQPLNNNLVSTQSNVQQNVSVPTSNATNEIILNEFKVTMAEIPTIAAESGILINFTTKNIYCSKEMNKKLDPAGLVNLMTAYLAVQKFDFDDVLTVNATAVKGIDKEAAIAGLDKGDTITLKDAIISMFMKGCVDSANVIAENVSGSIEEFVKLMNSTATSLGMKNTTFVNPSGINQANQLSTAYDMAIISGKVAENPTLLEYLHITQHELPKAKRRESLILYSKNSILNKDHPNYFPSINGSRLGFNTNAKHCISSIMNYKDNLVVSIVLKADGTYFSDTKKLIEFGKVACEEDFIK